MTCKRTDAGTQQEDRQTYRESLSLSNQARGENSPTTQRLAALYLGDYVIRGERCIDAITMNTGRTQGVVVPEGLGLLGRIALISVNLIGDLSKLRHGAVRIGIRLVFITS